MTTFSSPNRIVWEYFNSLKNLVQTARYASNSDFARQTSALAIVTAVTVAEVFLNLWFRIRVEERGNTESRESLLKDLKNRVSFQRKLEQWPLRYLAEPLDLKAGPGGDFMKLKSLRNSIVHFTSSNSSLNVDDVILHGLADTSDYDSLTAENGIWALETTEAMIVEIFRLGGISEKEIPHALHMWTGRPPNA